MRFDYRAAGPIAAASVLLLLSACSRTQQDWRVAQRAGTAQAYQVFAARHPHSELAGVARQRIAQLTEAAAWREATRADTVAAYQAYLARYPNGAWSQDARIRMQSRAMAAEPAPSAAPAGAPAAAASMSPNAAPLPAGAAGTGSAPAPVQSAARNAMPGQVAAAPPTPLTPPSRVGAAVQLGAFSSAANANTAWRRLSARLRPQLQGRVPRIVPVSVSGRRLYRLEVPVADRAAANRLCQQLQRHAQACLPVP